MSIENYFKYNFKISKTVLETKDNNNNISIKELDYFGKTLFINDRPISMQKDYFIYDEMICHVPMCTHNDPKKILIIGNKTGSMVWQLFKYPNIQIDIVEQNSTLLQIARDYFDFSKIEDKNSVNIISKNHIDFIKTAKEKSYDVIIVNNLQKDKDRYYHLHRILKDDGLFVAKSPSLWCSMDKVKQILKSAGMFFKISMPYRYEAYSNINFISNIILCSKKYHPTADIILQRADLLSDLSYYNSDIQKASFILPNHQSKELLGISKN